MGFQDSLDIANKSCFHLGVPMIGSPTEISVQNTVLSFLYDKVRRAEMRRNRWRFGIKRALLRALDANTMLLDPQPWKATVTYLPGSIVADTNEDLWISNLPDNKGNDPALSNVWDKYFGPMSVSLFDSTQSYFAGELVYKTVGNPGSYVVYLSLQNTNTDVPTTTTAYSAAVTYNRGNSVSYSGSQWESLIELNLANTPADAPTVWDVTATYASTNTVTGSDGYIYSSVGNGNLGNDPVTDAGVHWTNTNAPAAWSRTPTVYPSSIKWRPIYAGLENMAFTYPIGTGPSSQAITKNVYRLPAGYLREAAQNPKSDVNSFLGAPTYKQYDDWEYEGDYIVSGNSLPIAFRFTADVTDVREMDDMFCNGLALRMAEDGCEKITQSTEKLKTIAAEYKVVMGEARLVNAIELGAEDPPEDDWLTCRL